MIPCSLEEVLRWTGGERLAGRAGDVRFEAVSTDTRNLPKGALFVALRGEHHDAHAFLPAALAAGAAGLVVERDRFDPEALTPPALGTGVDDTTRALVIGVEDTTCALGALAAGHRAGFDGPVVAITGSSGKTTAKEMCAAILERRGPCLRNPGNWNNQIGLPLTLLSREAEHRALVVELGMNHAGEIAPLAAIARPTVGVITNVGTAHIGHLGSREAIAQEKGALVAALAEDAVAVLPAGDPLALAQRARSRARVVSFGEEPQADVRAEAVEARGAEGFAFTLVAGKERLRVDVAGPGRPSVWNALAAAAAALSAGATPQDVVAGLAAYQPVPGRMRHRALAGGAHLLDDSYNANPDSMARALHDLMALRGGGRALALLGEMGELGERAEAAHAEIGALAARLGIDRLVALGGFAEPLVAAARAGGLDEAGVADDPEAAGTALRGWLRAGDWVLVKGSRSARMERAAEALAADGETA